MGNTELSSSEHLNVAKAPQPVKNTVVRDESVCANRELQILSIAGSSQIKF